MVIFVKNMVLFIGYTRVQSLSNDRIHDREAFLAGLNNSGVLSVRPPFSTTVFPSSSVSKNSFGRLSV